jgi:hypothetical protein
MLKRIYPPCADRGTLAGGEAASYWYVSFANLHRHDQEARRKLSMLTASWCAACRSRGPIIMARSSPRLSSAGIGASRREIPSRMEFSERTGHRSPQAALILFNLGFGDFLGLILSPLTARPPTGAAKERGPGREWRPGLCLRKHPSCAG